jgi:hypothetical protein
LLLLKRILKRLFMKKKIPRSLNNKVKLILREKKNSRKSERNEEK